MKKRLFPAKPFTLRQRAPLNWRSLRLLLLGGLGLCAGIIVVCSGTATAPGLAQTPETPVTVPTARPLPNSGSGSGSGNSAAPTSGAPDATATAETEAPANPDLPARPKDAKSRLNLGPRSQYLLEFNRSPEIGNRFRMEGVYAESRLGFTRPKDWAVSGMKAVIRYQHSPALVADRSNLIVRVNDRSVGSIPLNSAKLKGGQIGEAIVNIPAELIQDYNEIVLVAQQENSPSCSNPSDKTLWTEVLPDSRLVFDYQPKAIPLDFAQYPYPFFDELGLEAMRLNYLQPAQVDQNWLTAASRFQAQMGRVADFRRIETQLVKDAKGFRWNDRLVIIGTPEQQPILKTLKLPLSLKGNQFIDRDKSVIANEEGLLMLTTVEDGAVPVLVITGNSSDAVRRAAQFLVQPQTSQIGTSALIQVKSDVQETAAPDRRAWPRFLPPTEKFTLKDIKAADGKAYGDVTVRGSSAPPVEFNFWALPDDRFLRGSSMTLRYSYGANADPQNSTVSVAIDGINVGSKKLSDKGGDNEAFTVDLPENLIKPDSKIRVDFKLTPKGDSERSCGRLTDQHLWGTVLSSTNFQVKREIGADLPDLKLFTKGYPFAELQDLSRMAVVLPDAPNPADVMTMLKFSERMGRLSRASSIRHEVYMGAGAANDSVKQNKHLVAIGTRDRLPLPEVFGSKKGFNLTDLLNRQMGNAQVQTLPNADGVIKSILSPSSDNRVVLALTAQSDQGLKQVQDVLGSDAWFYQLQGDTVLMSATTAEPNPYDPNGYRFQFLQESPRKTLENLNPLNKIRRFLQSNFYLLPLGIIAVSLLMYGIAQRYLKRVAEGR